MAFYRKDMTRRESRKLEEIYDEYKSNDNNMLNFAVLNDATDGKYEIGEDEITGKQLMRALENTGIIAIERKIESMMQELEVHYSPEIIIKSSFEESLMQKYNERLEQIGIMKEGIDTNILSEIKSMIDVSVPLVELNDKKNDDDVVVAQNEDMFKVIENDVFDGMVKDIERLKEKIERSFLNDALYQVAVQSNRCYIPEMDEANFISAKELYLIKTDENTWKKINYGAILSVIQKEGQLYIYNTDSMKKYLVTDKNIQQIIALLDIKLPVSIVSLGELDVQEKNTLEDIIGYIEDLEKEYQQNMDNLKYNEERLQKTYKGIEFATVEEKNKIIAKEEAAREYCKDLNQYGYKELFDKKEELSKLPNTIFNDYISEIITKMIVKEENEGRDWEEKIMNADINELMLIQQAISDNKYSELAENKLLENLKQRMRVCQKSILEEMTKEISKMTREELNEIKTKVREKGFFEDVQEIYLKKISEQYNIVEQMELQDICRNVEGSNLDELEVIKDKIEQGNYQEVFRKKYDEIIEKTIDFLHRKNLEEFCGNINGMDRIMLLSAKEKVDAEPCKADIKVKFYDLIAQREEILDYNDLKLLTSDIELKNLEEVNCIYDEIKSGSYNKKYIKEFEMKARLCLEKKQYELIENITSNILNSGRDDIEQVYNQIKSLGYEGHITSSAYEKIKDKQFELDMLELMKINNEFDSLTKEDIENVFDLSEQCNVSKESKKFYQEKLKERVIYISLENISQQATMYQQLNAKYDINFSNMKIATISPDYFTYLNEFKELFNVDDVYEMPIFILSGSPYIAMTNNRCYFKVETGTTSYALNEIHSFSTVKKFLFEVMAINLRNGNVITLPGVINKKVLARFIEMLNEFIANISNFELLNQYNRVKFSVSNFTEEHIIDKGKYYGIDEEYAGDLLGDKFINCSTATNKYASIYWKGKEKWETIEKKALSNLEISNETNLVWCYDNTIFGSVKEGMAVGTKNMYIKNPGKTLFTVPLLQIYEITVVDGNLKIDTIDNLSVIAEYTIAENEIMNNIASYLNEYIKTIQFISKLNHSEMYV